MSLWLSRKGFSLRESRLLFYERESGFGEHMIDYKNNLVATYVADKDGVVDYVLGGVGATANLLLKGPDHLYKAAVGQEFVNPTGIAGNTWADLKSLFDNVIHVHPLRAVGDAWSLATADVPLDVINALTGNINENTHYAMMEQTRADLQHTINVHP